jgi:hypothetical protein
MIHTKAVPEAASASTGSGGLGRRLLILLAVIGVVAAACGGTDSVDAGGSDQESSSDTDSNQDPDDGQVVDDPGGDDQGGNDQDGVDQAADQDGPGVADPDVVITTSDPSLISPKLTEILEVVRIDDTTLGVRYENAAEPCSLANVTVTEDDEVIELVLETGLHPNSAAMSCIAAVFIYEIQVELAQPVGDRQIVTAS